MHWHPIKQRISLVHSLHYLRFILWIVLTNFSNSARMMYKKWGSLAFRSKLGSFIIFTFNCCCMNRYIIRHKFVQSKIVFIFPLYIWTGVDLESCMQFDTQPA
jgi:hypothetical protein